MSTEKRLLARVDQLINQGKEAEKSAFVVYSPQHAQDIQCVDSTRFAALKAAALSFAESVYSTTHSHYRVLTAYSNGLNLLTSSNAITAVLQTIRDEIVGGWLETVRSLVSAEVFSDFLEMAEHLLEQGYKDPAAVMIGSVLEEHLRQLATKHSVLIHFEKDGKQVPKKADAINSELAKVEVYTKLDQKAVTAWLDLRNNAAHGKYDQYTKEQVQIMYTWVLDFVGRVSLK